MWKLRKVVKGQFCFKAMFFRAIWLLFFYVEMRKVTLQGLSSKKTFSPSFLLALCEVECASWLFGMVRTEERQIHCIFCKIEVLTCKKFLISLSKKKLQNLQRAAEQASNILWRQIEGQCHFSTRFLKNLLAQLCQHRYIHLGAKVLSHLYCKITIIGTKQIFAPKCSLIFSWD